MASKLLKSADHIPPFKNASHIFFCDWCRNRIYAPQNHHYRLVGRGGCEAYQKHTDIAWTLALLQDDK